MSQHSPLVGGSIAAMRLACPGSYQATLALPATAEISSVYAEEGTFAHACMDIVMKHRMQHCVAWADAYDYMMADAVNLVGMHVHDREVTLSHIEDMIGPAIDALWELEQTYGGGFKVLAIELRVRFPAVPGAFGTMDLVLGNSDTVLHIDWKFGSGVPVKAAYVHGDTETVNAQLLFYATAAKHSARHLYRGRPKMAVAIIQPRTATPLTHTTIGPKDIKYFRADIEKAIVTATSPNPPRARGDHCRFAPCKVSCPLWTGPMLEFMGVTDITAPEITPTVFGEYLAKAKALSDIAEGYIKEVNEQLHAFLEAGEQVPGWRLKAKAKQRQWVDEEIVEHALEDVGFDTKDIYTRKLVTFAAAEKTAKRLGVKIPEELRVAPPSTETTVCRTDDPAPVVTKAVASDQFRAALAQITATTTSR